MVVGRDVDGAFIVGYRRELARKIVFPDSSRGSIANEPADGSSTVVGEDGEAIVANGGRGSARGRVTRRLPVGDQRANGLFQTDLESVREYG
ncbi:hypothetical protein A6E15_08935 [Natrinema saccharevitans]|uniref:Uncharacterized protein n=1 Tax=Natrinema saccharevitans TaxID=301967 RepID=A0A1S8AW71_9EURY|nr:hypothetical protein A6E15_08935 [Natrinema saccharevitans]